VSSTAEDAAAQPAHWGLWGTILWGAFIAALFVALQVVTLFAVIIVRAAALGLSEGQINEQLQAAAKDGFLISLCTLVTTVCCCGAIALVVVLKKGAVLKDYLALRPVPAKPFAQWMVLLLVFAALSDGLNLLLGRPIVPEFMSSVYATANPLWMLWVALLVGAPLTEETFFRGFLFKGFASSRLGPTGAVVLTAALWAIIHQQYDAYDIGLIFVMGLLIGAARVRTGSIFVPIAMHAAASLVATIEAAAL
jgi:hypothetical protein